MNILLFGASGMVGQGVLRECLLDAQVTQVLVVGRVSINQTHAKLKEVLRPDLFQLSDIEVELAACDACFFCLGVSSAGMSEADYRAVTHDLTLSIAKPLAARNPQMTFIYVSGEGTDSSEKGGSMWARVKGQTENALLALFPKAVMFRPGFIQPMNGEKPKSGAYRVLYALLKPLTPVIRAAFSSVSTTTENVGRAMLLVAQRGAPSRVMHTKDINAMVASST